VWFRTLKSVATLLALTLLVGGCEFTRQYIYDPGTGDQAAQADVETAAEETAFESDPVDEPEIDEELENARAIPKIKVPPGVVIAPLQGLPSASALGLSADIARTLTQRNVRASSRSTEKISYLLEGRAHLSPGERGGTDFRIDWNLVAPDGMSAGRFSDRVPVAGSGWRAVTPGVLQPMANRAAVQVDILMQEHARVPSALPVPGVEIAELSDTLREVEVVSLLNPVVVEFVDGALGDGRTSLQTALIQALLKARVPVHRIVSEDTYIVLGDVHGTPISNTSQNFQFTWVVMRADGTLVGTASNKMDINQNRIDPYWGTVADVAIDDVIGDIVAVIDKGGLLGSNVIEENG